MTHRRLALKGRTNAAGGDVRINGVSNPIRCAIISPIGDICELDLVVQRSELIKRYPLFADLDEARLQQLVRNLKARYVNADAVIINRDTVEKKV